MSIAIFYLKGQANIEGCLHPWDKAHLVMIYDFLICCWILFARILLRIFESMFISDIGLQFSFFVLSLSGFGIRVIVAS